MMLFNADLHIHTVASPCGDLEMSPANILRKAVEANLQIIGIADHNCTKQAPLVQRLAREEGILALMGAEVTTREEIHCLCFFETETALSIFQEFIEDKLPKIPLDSSIFGYQVIVNEIEEIEEELPFLLITGLDASIDDVERKVHELNGIFIPAHIDKSRYSIISQLGFIPFDLPYDALEVTDKALISQILKRFPYLIGKTFIKNSDSHYIDGIGTVKTIFHIETPTFEEVSMALKSQNGRYVSFL